MSEIYSKLTIKTQNGVASSGASIVNFGQVNV